MEITQEYLLKHFEVSGCTLFRVMASGKKRPLSSCDANGHIRVKVLRRILYAHRIVFMMSNGYMPDMVDHIDGDMSNNSPENLRDSTPSEILIRRREKAMELAGHPNVAILKSGFFSVKVTGKNGLRYGNIHQDIESAMNEVDFLSSITQ